MSKKNRKTRKQKENIQSKNLSPSPQGNTPQKKELTPEVIKARVDGMAKSLPVRLIQIDLTIYLFLLLVVQPLVYHNGFADIGTTKWNFYAYVSFGLIRSPFIIIIPGCLIIALGLWIWYAIACAVQGVFKEIFHPRNLTVPDWFVLGFMIFTVISALQAPDKSVVLWGFPGWYMGMMAQLSFGWIYFLVSRFLRDRRLIIYALICAVTGATIVSVIGILNRNGIDVLGLYETTWGNMEGYEVTPKMIAGNGFVSTIGNRGWYSAYLCVIFSIPISLFYASERLLIRILGGGFSAVILMAIITSGAEAVIPGMAAFFLVLLFLSFRSIKMLLRFLETITLSILAIHIPGVVFALRLKKNSEAVFSYGAPTLQSIAESPIVNRLTVILVALTMFVILIRFLCGICRGPADQTTDNRARLLSALRWQPKDPAIGRVRLVLIVLRWSMVGLCAAAFVGVLSYISLNTQGKLSEKYSSSSAFLDMNQYKALGWRWRIWNTTLTYYSDEWHRHPMRLIFGMGPDSLYQVMNEHQEELKSLARDTMGNEELYLTNAHNEWLTMWIDQGMVGVILYLGSFLTVFLCCARRFLTGREADNGDALCQILWVSASSSIMAYFAHNFFSYQQISAAPFMFSVMGIGMFVERVKLESN